MSAAEETTDESGTERRSAQTYVPTHQYEQWSAEAESMEMSISEYVRTMVQAGRSDLDPPNLSTVVEGESATRDSASDPGGQRLEERVEAALDEDEYVAWDELRESLTDDLDERLETALESLQEAGRVTHSGRHGGYTLS